MRTRPSPRAAIDLPVKVVGAIIGFYLPFQLAALFTGQPISLFAALTALQLIQIVPVVAAASLPAIRLLFTTYTADVEGLRVETRILASNTRMIPWNKVTALVERRTFIDRLLGIARITVIAYGQAGARVTLVGLRDPDAFRIRVAQEMRDSASVAALFGND